MNLPLILKDKNDNILKQHITVTEPTFFIKSYKKFGITFKDITKNIDEISDINHTDIFEYMNGFDFPVYSDIIKDNDRLEEIFDTDKPLIYSVYKPLQNDDAIEIVKGNTLTKTDSNYSYTLYLGEKEKLVILCCYDYELNKTYFLQINYRPYNKLNSDEEHYQDYIDNYSLPNIDELSSIIFKEENKYIMLRKLLLDFREIKKHKGKLKSIERFLNYLGFDPDTIKLYPEYITPKNIKTINPDKSTDIKTGYYHLVFDNFEIDSNKKYEPDNLPYIKTQFKDIDELFDKLVSALSIAHKYFTIDEQQLSFVGINNMFNSRRYLSVASNMTTVFNIDTLYFRKDVDIQIFNQTAIQSNPFYIVKNNVQKNIDVKKTEVKYYNKIQPSNNQIFFVDREIVDERHRTDLPLEEQKKIISDFGNIINLKIYAPNLYIKYKIVNTNNELIQYNSDKIFVDNNLYETKIFLRPNGLYKITIYVYDMYGSREEYIYQLRMNQVHIDFDIFDSSKIIYDYDKLTSPWDGGFLTQDIDSTVEISERNSVGNNKFNQVIKTEYTTKDKFIDNYFEYIIQNQGVNNFDELYGFKQYSLPRLNKNIIMSKLTETLPTQFVDNFINIITFKNLGVNTNLNPLGTMYNYQDLVSFVTKPGILKDSNGNSLASYWVITPLTNSVDINPYLHDFYVVHKGKKYTLEDILNNKLPEELDYKNFYLPLNYDIELFNKKNITSNAKPVYLESLFPRLNNRSFKNNINIDTLKLGDIFVCRINNKYISGAKDIEWTLINSVTQQVISKQKSYTLKHRITKNEMYDILLTLNIDGTNYNFRKNNIISSFEI